MSIIEFIRKALSKNDVPSSMRLFNAWTMGLGIPTLCAVTLIIVLTQNDGTTKIGAMTVLAGLVGTVLKFKKDQVKLENGENKDASV